MDDTFSIDSAEFAAFVRMMRAAGETDASEISLFALWDTILGKVNYTRAKSEKVNVILRRSLYVVEDMKAGEIFTERNLRSIRPSYGLEPKHLPYVLGKRAVRPLKRGTALTWDMV